MQGVINGSGSSTLLGCMTDSARLQVAFVVSPQDRACVQVANFVAPQ